MVRFSFACLLKLILNNSKPKNQMCDGNQKCFWFVLQKSKVKLFYMTRTFDSEVSLHLWLLWSTMRQQCSSRKSFCAPLPLRTVGYSGTRLVPTTYSFLLLLSWLAKIPPKFSTDDFSWAWLAKERKLLYLPSLLRLRPKSLGVLFIEAFLYAC